MLLTSVVMKVCSRILPATSMSIVLITPAEYQAEFSAPLSLSDDFETVPTHRHKRETYDPYDAYYFYPKSLNQGTPNAYDLREPENSYIKRSGTDEFDRDEDKNRQKYKYTPLFQYKSTQSRRRKLFVPNLFG